MMEFLIIIPFYLEAVFKLANSQDLCSSKETLGFSGKKGLPIRVFAADFDGTISTVESKSFVEHINLANARYIYGSMKTKQKMDRILRSAFKTFDDAIDGIVRDTLEKTTSASKEVKTERGRILLQEALKKIDREYSVLFLSGQAQNRFFKGITVSGIKRVARKIHLMPGVLDTLRHFQSNAANIISASPSKKFIENVLRENNAPRNLKLHVGQLLFKNGVSTGKIVGYLFSFNKENIMASLIKQHQKEHGFSVYVGNDFVDTLALLKADIGIAINSTPLFTRFLNALGINTPPISEWRETGACSNKENLIYIARSWYEIEELLFDGNIKGTEYEVEK